MSGRGGEGGWGAREGWGGDDRDPQSRPRGRRSSDGQARYEERKQWIAVLKESNRRSSDGRDNSNYSDNFSSNNRDAYNNRAPGRGSARAVSELQRMAMEGHARAVAVLMLMRVEEGAEAKGAFGLVGEAVDNRKTDRVSPEVKALDDAIDGEDGDNEGENMNGDGEMGGEGVGGQGAFSLQAAFNKLSAPDRRWTTRVVQGVTRLRARLDWQVAAVAGRPRETVDDVPWVAMQVMVYAITEMQQPAHVCHAYVDVVKRACHEGVAGLVNAVARKVTAREVPVPAAPPPSAPPSAHVAYLSLWGSHPAWMVERWVERWGVDAATALIAANNATPHFGVRANAAMGVDAQGLLQACRDILSVKASPSPLLPTEFIRVTTGLSTLLASPLLSKGACAVQDEGAGLVVAMLDPQPGEAVLDMCAAPGGKATFAAARMMGKGVLLATDSELSRQRKIEVAVARQGLGGVVLTQAVKAQDLHANWTRIVLPSDPRPAKRVAELQDRVKIQAGKAGTRGPVLFDRVLVDAPCTGTGVLAKRSDLRWRRTMGEMRVAVDAQRELLSLAADLVRPGGLLVYATCSIEAGENEGQVEAFLRERKDYRLEGPREGTVPASVLDARGVTMQTLPHVHGVDGAFAARLRRVR